LEGQVLLLIKNGRVLDPASGIDRVMDLLLEGDVIREMGENLSGEPVLDATGLVVAPGLIDTHVHFRDPGYTHKETLHTGALAAARGGFTSVVCMANTNPVTDSPALLQEILRRAEKEDVRIYQAAAVTQGLGGKVLTDFAALKQAGAACFSDDGVPLTDSALALKAMEQIAALDGVLCLHEEDPALVGSAGVNAGKVAQALGLLGAPAYSESSLIARDCMLALATGARVVIQHISTKAGVEMVRFARSLGAKVEAEVTPHHVSQTQEAVLELGTLAKMNPPLRTEEDRLAVIQGLADGTINLIATDHAPHSAEEKARDFFQAPSGILGLETALAVGITYLVEPGYLTLGQLIEKMSANPAKIYGIKGGSLRPGGPADLVLFHPKETWKVEGFASKSSNSPFLHKTLSGKVRATICRGKVVFQRGATP